MVPPLGNKGLLKKSFPVKAPQWAGIHSGLSLRKTGTADIH